MAKRSKRPDPVRQHEVGAGKQSDKGYTLVASTYASCSELQSRHVMRRCGVGRRQAAVIAGLLFGEGRG